MKKPENESGLVAKTQGGGRGKAGTGKKPQQGGFASEPVQRKEHKNKCSATRSSGYVCRNYAMLDSDYCVVHDPRYVEKNIKAVEAMKAARIEKGRLTNMRAFPKVFANAGDIVQALKITMHNVLTNRITPATANSVASIAGKMLSCMTANKSRDVEQTLRLRFDSKRKVTGGEIKIKKK